MIFFLQKESRNIFFLTCQCKIHPAKSSSDATVWMLTIYSHDPEMQQLKIKSFKLHNYLVNFGNSRASACI